jgi:ATP-dependent RNA/DNA helicase IGHMBP2
MPSPPEDHFARLARLLALEAQAAAQQATERARRLAPAEAERSGTSLVDLVVRDEEPGLGGRYLLRLGKRKRSPLPWTRLGVGSPVVLTPTRHRGAAEYRGVICQRAADSVQVALGSLPDDLDEHETWRLDLSSDDVATDRQRRAIHDAGHAKSGRLAELRDVLLVRRAATFRPEKEEPALDAGLNQPQQAAVRFALSSSDVALIHGPPGTGKTTTVVELIRREVRRGHRVLVCAPSNTAVDNLLEKLVDHGEDAVRLGHPARVTPALRSHTLDLLVEDHPDFLLARKMMKEALRLFREADRRTRAKPAPGARQEARREAKSLLADARKQEDQAATNILDTARIVCATTTGLDGSMLGARRFDLAVIDEACQSTEPGSWIPLLRCDRVVLAGDHCQLPPTVVSREAAGAGFHRSLFERLMADLGPQIARRLTVQYRMHRSIMEFSSREFYDGELIADATVREHLLSELPGVLATPVTQTPIDFIDTAGASFDEEVEPDGESRQNPREAELVSLQIRRLIEAGLPPSDIAVIAPYAAQVRRLRELLPIPALEIDSVDGFQGREKEAVIISLVRSNPEGEIGFLADVRRMNVALTRARRKLIVIGDSATLSGHPFYRRMIEHFEGAGAYRTVWEEGTWA